jgi:hypothetical protein
MMGRKNGERFNLTKALGPLGMVRFIQQFETGVDKKRPRGRGLLRRRIKNSCGPLEN